MCVWLVVFFFFKQKTAYEMRISDWSSDVCSSDLRSSSTDLTSEPSCSRCPRFWACSLSSSSRSIRSAARWKRFTVAHSRSSRRSEEHTSELQSLMRISYAVFCLKKKNSINSIAHNQEQDRFILIGV